MLKGILFAGRSLSEGWEAAWKGRRNGLGISQILSQFCATIFYGFGMGPNREGLAGTGMRFIIRIAGYQRKCLAYQMMEGRPGSNLALCFLCAKMKIINELLLIGIVFLTSITGTAGLEK
jgi:hypothetical protein